jgi:hypothetical protein
MFPIWFYELPEDNEDDYDGAHQGQMHITSDDVMRLQGDVASPAALKKEIEELRSTIANWKAWTIGLIGTGFAAALWTTITAMMKK